MEVRDEYQDVLVGVCKQDRLLARPFIFTSAYIVTSFWFFNGFLLDILRLRLM